PFSRRHSGEGGHVRSRGQDRLCEGPRSAREPVRALGCPMSARSSIRRALFAALLVAGCARSIPDASNRACPCDETDAKPVDQVLLAWLSKARTLHHLADLAEGEGSIDEAIAPL